jgi:hypothetical protein
MIIMFELLETNEGIAISLYLSAGRLFAVSGNAVGPDSSTSDVVFFGAGDFTFAAGSAVGECDMTEDIRVIMGRDN